MNAPNIIKTHISFEVLLRACYMPLIKIMLGPRTNETAYSLIGLIKKSKKSEKKSREKNLQ